MKTIQPRLSQTGTHRWIDTAGNTRHMELCDNKLLSIFQMQKKEKPNCTTAKLWPVTETWAVFLKELPESTLSSPHVQEGGTQNHNTCFILPTHREILQLIKTLIRGLCLYFTPCGKQVTCVTPKNSLRLVLHEYFTAGVTLRCCERQQSHLPERARPFVSTRSSLPPCTGALWSHGKPDLNRRLVFTGKSFALQFTVRLKKDLCWRSNEHFWNLR